MFPIQAHRSLRLILFGSVLAIATGAHAGDLRIKIPKRSKSTPVQKLNQDGVKAVQKHDYEKAKRLFYKAYLLDPNDPFTLNNLGYIAELEGEIERAQRYYALAAEQPSGAEVAVASDNDLKGKQVDQVAGNAADRQMQVNRINVYAMGLLLKDRAPEADVALNKALALDPKNPFTLNNLGWAKEKEGELEVALRYYSQAHDQNSNEPVIVTVNKDWRGKSISEIAGENAKNVRRSMDRDEGAEAKVARLNLRGVSAINRNDRRLAREYFEQAYKMDPKNAFTLNNMGYIAELDGDRETANFFYDKATAAQRSDSRVAVATRRDLEGMRMGNVATANGQAVDQAVQASIEERRREGGPVVLKRRGDNSPIIDPDRPPPQPKQTQPQGQAQQQERIPVYSQPDANGAIQEVIPPLENQPNAAQPNSGSPGGALPQGSEPTQPPANQTQPQGEPSQTQPAPGQNPPGSTAPTGGVIEPLPDNQQPGNAGPTTPQSQPQQQAQPSQTQSPQGQQTPGANSPVQGVIEPLPDNQQPPNAGQQPSPQNPK
jgi:Flp pilus assembly protein TadD